jgi:Chaperone of endosialidase
MVPNTINQSSERKVKSSISGVTNTIVILLLVITTIWLWYRVNNLEKRLQTTMIMVSQDEANLQQDEIKIGQNASNIQADESVISQNATIFNNFVNQLRYSDIRLKDNIGSIPNPLDGILALNGIRFTWNSEGLHQIGTEPGYHYGLIAQDVQKVFPELVQSDPNGYLKVDYDQMIPVLVDAIQEQQTLIVALQNQLSKKK